MAFDYATASSGERTPVVLSADNARPERHLVIDTLRQAAPLIGLKAPVIATLDAMLSCLAPGRQHNTVFASNATLAFRRNGISDRTIRRHAAILQDLGLLVRRDSPNRKRFTRRSVVEGKTLRFGFDLSPLFERFTRIAELAREANREKERIAYLRTKIRAAANAILLHEPDNAHARHALSLLRRKLTPNDCEALLTRLNAHSIAAEHQDTTAPPVTPGMSAKHGQFVRHHHNSNRENIDRPRTNEPVRSENRKASKPISIRNLVEVCTEAAQFTLAPTVTMADIITHARLLAPMMGIDDAAYRDAQKRHGPEGAALTVWGIMQFRHRIREVGAYFRAITSGSRSQGFCPKRLIHRLASEKLQPA